MRPHDHPESQRDDAAFDAAMRARYQQATEHLSGRTRLQLDAARHAAPARIAGARPALGHARADGSGTNRRPLAGWALAGAFASLAALAIALQLRPTPIGAPVNPAPVASVVPDDAAADAVTDPAIVLDENPDLYLWLAVNDDAPTGSLEY